MTRVGLALALSSARILETLDLWTPLSAAVTPIERVHVSDRGRFGFARLRAADLNLPALGYVVIARALGGELIAALEHRQAAQVLCPARVCAVQVKSAHALVTLAQNGTERQLSTRLIIAADGADSVTRSMLGVQAQYHDYDQVALVTTVAIEHEHANTAYERFTPDGPLAVLPLPGRRCGVVLTLNKQAAAEVHTGQQFCTLAGERFSWRLGEFSDAGRLVRYPLRRVIAECRSGPRFVVIGNAAQSVHPNAAQGFNLGLRQSALLGETLAHAARHSLDLGDAQALNAFTNASERDRQRVTMATHGLATLFYNDLPPLAALRNVAMLAIDFIPPLKRSVITTLAGLDPPQPRLVQGLAL